MECHDRCARFHIIALHLERDNAGFSHALEEQQLMNSMSAVPLYWLLLTILSQPFRV